MKIGFNITIIQFFIGLAATSYSLAQTPDVLPQPESTELKETLTNSTGESADVTLLQKTKKSDKVVAKISLEDRHEGLSVVLSSESLEKGHYVIKLEDNCAKKKAMRGDAVKLGSFSTSSGFISSEFFKKDLSVSDKFQSVAKKAISLSKLESAGQAREVACAVIAMEETVVSP